MRTHPRRRHEGSPPLPCGRAGPGRTEITGSFSSVSYSQGGQTETVQREYTAQLALGTGARTDWRFRYTYIGPPDGGSGALHAFGVGPKSPS